MVSVLSLRYSGSKEIQPSLNRWVFFASLIGSMMGKRLGKASLYCVR